MIEFHPKFIADSKYMESCDIEIPPYRMEPFTLVIFGGAGDLSTRKLLPTLCSLFQQGEFPATYAILGVGLPGLGDEAYRALTEEACRRALGAGFREDLWKTFRESVFYQSGGFAEPETYRLIKERIGTFAARCGKRVIHYLAVPPDSAPAIVGNLDALGLCGEEYSTKVVVEKPFGRDRASATELNRVIRRVFEEERIYRMDHYLGKETVQNIIFFRFSNAIFEQLWNSRYVDNVQITVAESLGIEHRGGFYERTGVVRDILQNHLLQLAALVAMEPPVGFAAELIRDERVKVLRSVRPLDAAAIDSHAVRGQYGAGAAGGAAVPGYRAEEGVAPDSAVPTFVAARLSVANWRWAGVPFYVRTGKRLARQVTEICIQFRQPPLRLFGRSCDELEPNTLSLTLQPEEGIRMRFGVKYPGAPNKIYPATMSFSYGDTFAARQEEPYGRLLLDCMRGDLTLFVRQDEVEAAWEVVDPLVARWEEMPPAVFPNYAAGSWGPEAADELLRTEGRRWLTS
jgi:glucose-6-phosphate 1-dehydrogenase